MIVFDLEWNNGRGELLFDEIIQIGAVKLDMKLGKITDTLNIYVHPSVQKSMSRVVKKLPELSKSLESTLSFKDAATMFFEWCGNDRDFGTWGNSDFPVLASNISYWDVQAQIPDSYTDLQKAFGKMVGTNDQIALSQTAEYCGFPDSLTFHDALTDAVYTAFVATITDEKSLSEAVCKAGMWKPISTRYTKINDRLRLRREALCPYDNETDIFKDSRVRIGFCPVCNSKSHTSCWRGADENTYYAAFNCGEHGKFYAELIICFYEPGGYGCERSMLLGTETATYVYKHAKQKLIFCEADPDRKRKFRRKAKKTGKKPEAQPASVLPDLLEHI